MNSKTLTWLGIAAGIIIVVSLILRSCTYSGGEALVLTNTPPPIATAAPTKLPLPTATNLPTKLPPPTATQVPTSKPQPSATSEPVNPPNPIQNILWQWVSVTNQSTNTTTIVPNPPVYTISFYPDGTLSGKADCNTFSGTYSQQNGFSINLGASTQMTCGEGSLDQEYMMLLGNVAAGGPDGAGNLSLETAGGAQRMLFKNGGATVKP
jgi:heat shock protein HslJ